ncbi:Hypothetical predicted protein [Xyrichtys novacula]|uniref:Uncharacterized protein n=1 Tax=Xyrichtys novacula TaxID=13765 RepID=A0AAV1H8J6_XYRNO|nr:Hypothetical predicted protein [Xyrichtys novacula]
MEPMLQTKGSANISSQCLQDNRLLCLQDKHQPGTCSLLQPPTQTFTINCSCLNLQKAQSPTGASPAFTIVLQTP